MTAVSISISGNVLLFFLFLLLYANEQLLNSELLSSPIVLVGAARKPVLHVLLCTLFSVLSGMWLLCLMIVVSY